MVVRGERTVSHVAHDPALVRPRRAEVAAVTDLTPRMRRVTLRGDLADLPGDGPTDHVKLFFPLHGEESVPDIGPRGLLVPPPGTPRPYREYTVRRHDGEHVDVDVVRHGSGLASSWAEDPAGALWLLGPRSSLEVAPRDWYLLGGDETALPALARWLERVPSDATVIVLAEVADAAEEAYLADPRVRWLHRDGVAAGESTLLADALADLEVPAGRGVAWMGAEASALRPVRRRLRDWADRGLPPEAVDLDGYWRRGVEGTGLG
jgi:NADPH-dependent ferric siderophore reductase